MGHEALVFLNDRAFLSSRHDAPPGREHEVPVLVEVASPDHGADLLNLGNIRGLGAPVASIGGAGTFDGIFLIGIVAVLIASLTQAWSGQRIPQ